MPIKNTGTDKDPSTSFYFACDYCGEPIEDLNGVVDFPSTHRSEKIKQPYRFYHKGLCAFQGDKLRKRDKWGNFSLRAFVLNLLTGADISNFFIYNYEEKEVLKLICKSIKKHK
tara:strand:+ start:622 stop:963 length:342 start_codon:yes stop_codon:yes gene_type:complete